MRVKEAIKIMVDLWNRRGRDWERYYVPIFKPLREQLLRNRFLEEVITELERLVSSEGLVMDREVIYFAATKEIS